MKNIMFGEIEVESHYSKYRINVSKVDIVKTITSDKVSFGYKDDEKVKPLFVIIPKMSGYRRN